MTLSLRQLEIIRAIMRAGTVTEAAAHLGVTQPAVSRILKLAEDRLGLLLFERRNGRLHPSPELRSLYPEIERIYDEIDSVLRAADDLRTVHGGRLTIVANPSIASTVIARAIAEFMRTRPDVRVHVRSALNFEIADTVMAHRADIGFGFDLPGSRDLEMMTFGLSRLVCVCPADHPLADIDPIGPADIDPYPLISFNRSLAIGEAIDVAFSEAGVTRKISIDVGQSFVACALVAAGAGVTVVDSLTASTWQSPDLAIRAFGPSRSLSITGVAPVHSRLSLAADAFLDCLRQRC
jgi:DNA-binding transcriptional LysR family regulator